MTQTDAAFAGSIPALYERHLGPLLFEPYAADIAARLADFRGTQLLETAAGTGVVTRALAGALPGTQIVATDLNQPMLDFAAASTRAANVTWRQADATALPFGDGSFDGVVCQFGVMFFPDRPAGYREAWRVLRPGGRFLFNVWDSLDANELPRTVHDCVAAMFPDDPPGFLGRTPYGYFDVAAIEDALRAAGFTRVEVDTVGKRSRCPSPRDAAMGFCRGTPLLKELEARDPQRLDEAVEVASSAVAARFGPGPVDASMQAHVFTAWR